jgi:hypothetical protein
MKTSVAFFIFKRPDTTEKVFEVIRQAKPSKLLVIADGPRPDRLGEAEKCAAVRAIIDRVDWDCEVLKNYSEINLGAGKRVSSGLDWVFDKVEEAIILEDDCVPHPTFFRFCEELLERYRYDTRIFLISAQNVQLGRRRTEYSYYFSRYTHIWGWATWRRAWLHYDFDMKLWPEIKVEGFLNDILLDSQGVKYWTEILQAVYEKRIDTCWDYQWTFACWLQRGLSIIPNVNLVSNIGFGPEATHFKGKRRSKFDAPPIEALEFPLKHPPFVIRNAEADNFTQKNIFRKTWFNQIKTTVKKRLRM